MRRILCATALAGLVTSSAWADVTITQTTTGKGLGMSASGQSLTFIKGTKLRTESTIRGETLVTILDIDKQQMISLNLKKKEAEIIDLTKLSAEMAKTVSANDLKVDIKPNGQTKEILGKTTTGYDLTITAPVRMGGDPKMAMTMVLAGPVWIAKDAPGSADYARFYIAAAEKGMFFGNPDVAKAQPGQARGMTEMYRAMAKIGGMAYGTDIEVKMSGEGMMGGLLGKMGGMSASTVVTAVNTDPIADDRFTVPADFKTRTR
jgi:hypothetical protein